MNASTQQGVAAKKPAPTPKSAILQKIVASRGPINRMRARNFGFRKPLLEFFYEAGDPHSHLAAQLLPALRAQLGNRLRVWVVDQRDFVAYPEPERQRGFALLDAQRIAPAWGLGFPAQPAVADDAAKLEASRYLAVAAMDGVEAFIAAERQIGASVFSGAEAVAEAAEGLTALTKREAQYAMERANDRREYLGHYLPGMWCFDGDWFWGLDRLNFLERSLREHNLWRGAAPIAELDAKAADLPEMRGNKLSFYFSFRSPYSYLAAVQIQRRFADWKARGVELDIRPVLPMAMRGLSIPLRKRFYIPRDCYRLAAEENILFDRIADPIGAGAERCLNTFRFCSEDSEQQLQYLCEAGVAVWGEGIDVASDEGLAWVCQQSGIDWNEAEASINAGIDLSYAEQNKEALFEQGLWGVPCLTTEGFATWGQDRLWMIDEMLRRAGNGVEAA